MKSKIFFAFAFFVTLITGCNKNLDVAPPNILNESDVFGTTNGITAYMAKMYADLPMEDFRYAPANSFNSTDWNQSHYASAMTGEALSRGQGSNTETFDYFGGAYTLIRRANLFIQTIPKYASLYNAADVKSWIGEAQFIRGVTYFALVKRLGGVPLVDKVLTKEGATIDDLIAEKESFKIPRSSEDSTYMFVANDLDSAYANMAATNTLGRATKYAAAAFKSRAMLFAASIAKYNTISLMDGTKRLCGIDPGRAAYYYKASIEAANLLNGQFSLYKNSWSATDKNAQYQNFVNLFFDAGSKENIFVRQFKYPSLAHSYDWQNVPRQLWGGTGSSQTCPTLDFVEMFDGLPLDANGRLKTTTGDGQTGTYNLYTNPMDLFANAEPRLRATVVLPGDMIKGQPFDARRGYYYGAAGGPAAPFTRPANATALSVKPLDTVAGLSPRTYVGGTSGYFSDYTNPGSLTGFSIRKYIVADKATADVTGGKSDQTWIEMRYAEVLLNRAEAAFELSSLGEGSYLAQALTDINAIQDRAGASKTASGDLTRDIIRKERRKELAFENKTWWDLIRWRIGDSNTEQPSTGRVYRILNPFFSTLDQKYFFETKSDEKNTIYKFNSQWYYKKIPQASIDKSPNLKQNPGY
ncbi:RagB/SusD family nutrient uptake outer membrane protein [Pinibacter aurantiacus]|uniref:RagB/SusD family nutrient uptake outer membrane protein n=1 Tax=Pinibacter aurantiacus TaxID=2851599 RepID=A0A9E2SD07_9BACT|nr:RagB/SusD family nutrient uptake outer membrane protein [Pinibacter aurantiacus]MBV4358220.1 RagB/SusD family nutrient uptake outer membrane protein [Pinibacter aurantiacus]